jgi:hypothetical protein
MVYLVCLPITLARTRHGLLVLVFYRALHITAVPVEMYQRCEGSLVLAMVRA